MNLELESLCTRCTLGYKAVVAGNDEEFYCGTCAGKVIRFQTSEIAALQSRIDRAWKRLEEWRERDDYDNYFAAFASAQNAVNDAQAILKEE